MRASSLLVLVLASSACNAPPYLASVTLGPGAPTTTDDLVLELEAVDPDDDEVELTITWSLDGSPVASLDDETRVPATQTAKGQVWSVSVVASDGVLSSPALEASVTVANTAPSAGSVSITPSAPAVTDGLTCTPAGFEDVDGDPEAWRFAWTVDGVDLGDQPSLPAGSVSNGQVAVCTAIPTDGDEDGVPVSAQVTGINTPPVLRAVTLAPADPSTADDIVATPGDFGDVDGDDIRFVYAWTVGGEPSSVTSDTLPAGAHRKGDQVEVVVTPWDEVAGEPVAASTRVVNSPPVLSAPTITPAEPTALDALSCEWSADDADDDEILAITAWTIDGRNVGSGPTLAAGVAIKGDTVRAEVVVSDGVDTDSRFAEVTVGNTAPTAPVLLMEPGTEAIEGRDELVCTVATASFDPDPDDLTYTVSWTVDGVAWTGSTETTAITGDTIASSQTSDGETWECTVSADDGTATSPGASASVEIIGCTTSTVYINATDSGSVSYGSTREVWKDNRVRALNNGSVSDVVGWLLFDLSSVDSSAEVLSASVDLFEEAGAVGGVPKMVFVESPSTGWSRSSLTTTSVVKGGKISGETTSFTLTGWNTFALDVDDWDWGTALSKGEATIGADNVSFGESHVYWHGPDTTGKIPELALEIELCE